MSSIKKKTGYFQAATRRCMTFVLPLRAHRHIGKGIVI
jgi:hypothetical protein